MGPACGLGHPNVPRFLTTFVGRQREVADIKGMFAGSRLVTLTGVGGVGKTRLALQVAGRLDHAFPDGVRFVGLAKLTDPGVLVHVLAAALGLRDEIGQWDPSALADRLSDRQLLIVLDNCEHLIDACALLVGAILRGAAGVRVLATSREPLSIPGEQLVQVPPLALPDAETPPPLECLTRCDSVRLFAERAAQVLSGFTVGKDNRATVTDICRQLDGIPLAIELAAAQLRSLSLEQLRDGLRDRFRLLRAEGQDLPDRQRTLQALIAWSYQLCSAKERTVWIRSSVFRGGFDLEAAEAVCSDDGLSADEKCDQVGGLTADEVFEQVGGLIDKSVLLCQEHNGRTRYRMLETLSEYGAARLGESGEAGAVMRRHRDWYRQLAGRVAGEIFGPDQLEWFTRLRVDHANLRVALECDSTDPGQAEAVQRVAADLRSYWLVTGFLGEGRRVLDRALALDTRPTRARAAALWVDAWLALMQGDLDAARPLLKESGDLAEKVGDEVAGAWATQLSGYAAMGAGELTQAESMYRAALPHHRATDDELGIVCALDRMAVLAALNEDFATGIVFCEEALALCEARGERFNRAVMLWVLSLLHWRRGDTADARAAATESIRLASPFDDPIALARAMEVLAWIIAAEGPPERAATLFGALDGLWRSFGGAPFPYLRCYHDECVAKTREVLGAVAYGAAFQRGGLIPRARLLAYALGESAPDAPMTSDTLVTTDGRRGTYLTHRERQIAELIAQGLSNKQIAARLLIAQRTAESHVEHVLGKLGFTSRAQIAAWVVQDRPTSSSAAEPEPPGGSRTWAS
ncbi:LuxR C-terminal-related transcriptional regulator [Actinoallomurus purpureus]|uniref:ATP-binding protein n=1 Tax=Actinoallomurus purpureus TaxID=478114 RepID=UPI00209282DE|nr:LuxR C-terminal-related transcriptional regulator [Actinoallomurus purpureus]MCO6004527.1 LuxR C-terminal-related transcriptional regulator [Actinoallomurus purpureus]